MDAQKSRKRLYISIGIISVVAATMIIVISVLFALVSVGNNAETLPDAETLPPTCDSLIYCQGNLLHTVQRARIFEDSKTFVDMSQRNDVEITLENFDALMNETDNNPTSVQVAQFVDSNFLSEDELDDWIPDDFVAEPSFLSTIADLNVQEFARNIVGIWGTLGKKVKADVYENPEKHSLIYVPNGFVIPGGRFREYYYWDSYWIIKGLLLSEMTETAKGMIENFLHIVDNYGHVPNGGRVYYLQRSQPPLLSYMARRLFEHTGDIDWVQRNIDLLEKEVQFWVDNRMVQRNINWRTYNIGVYNARSAGPRPESYNEDFTIAQFLKSEDEKNELYIELKSAAESGWDFSTRWIIDENGNNQANLSYTKITQIAPVDLNAFLYGAFENMAYFQHILNNAERYDYWTTKAYDIYSTINEVLWNEEDGIWYDLDLDSLEHRQYFAPSNLAPLWSKAYGTEGTDTGKLINRIVSYLEKEGITNYLGGIPATTINSGEQWDLPNAWPPLQTLVINGLYDSGTENGQNLARIFAQRWVEANMIGYGDTKDMFEKYDAENPGQYGGGGEYEVQIGFGWTNGVVLEFIDTYYCDE